MQVHQFKDHFILNQNLNQISIIGRAVLLLLAFYSTSSFATLKIALLDTGFCHNQNQKNNSIILPAIDMTNSVSSINCDLINKKMPRFHGQKVLETFLLNLKTKESFEIQPIVLYDNNGMTKLEYWIKTLDYLSKNKYQYVISAIGIKDQSLKINENIETIWFLAAARVSPFIAKSDSVFPQNQFNLKNVYLFGSFDKSGYVDRGQLNLNEIDLFVKEEDSQFSGSSFAVGKIAGLILSQRSGKNLIKNIPGTFLLKDSR